jgi:hypothetical protein
MNRDYLSLLLLAILLIILQWFIFDNVMVADIYSPFVYILLLFYYPYQMRLSWQLIISFLAGLCIDIVNDTGGAHALAMLFASYLRPLLLRLNYGESYALKTVRLVKTSAKPLFVFTLLLVFIHHLILHAMLLFDGSLWDLILIRSFYNLLLTTFVVYSLILLFYKRSREVY